MRTANGKSETFDGMEQKNILRKKFLAVLKAAIWGAVIFDSIIVLANVLESMGERGYPVGPLRAIFNDLGWMLIIAVSLMTPEGQPMANAYVVDGILGALVFSAVAAFWQFILKGNNEKQNSGIE